MRTSLLATAVLLSGCMLIDNIAPQARLTDTVHELNDEVRWGRIDLAAQRVAGTHRAAFIAQHREWGRDIRLADVEVTGMEMNLPDGSSASTVTYGWIDERTMELRTTSVRQRWVGEGEGFVLASETIIGGEPELLAGAPILGESGDDEVEGETVTTSGDDEGWTSVPVSDDTEVATGDEDETAGPAPAPSFIPPPSQHRDGQGVIIR